MSFLGVVIDTVACTLSIPEEKLSYYHSQVNLALEEDAAQTLTVKLLESLLGRLSWYCEVLTAGRARLHRIRKCIPGGGKYHPRPATKVSLSEAAKEDLRWWSLLMAEAAQHHRAAPFWTSEPPVYCNIFSDASGEIGFGLVMGDSVYQGLWNQDAAEEFSCYQELVPVLLAILLLPSEANRKIVIINTDNLSNVLAINKGSCSSEGLYPILFAITELAAERQIYLIANWIPREKMDFCDGISRYPWFKLV